MFIGKRELNEAECEFPVCSMWTACVSVEPAGALQSPASLSY